MIGIVSVWLEGNPCNMHLLDLSGHVKEGVEKSKLTGFRFNTIGVSDGKMKCLYKYEQIEVA